MFIDIAKIKIKAGDGGDGAVSFHREKYIASGGPDGGDGGKGGNIVFVVDDNTSTLSDFRYKRKFFAENGCKGSSNKSSGKGGKDLIIRVPRGTLVKDSKTDRIIFDMSQNEPYICAYGGRGGWGNHHFATPTRQTPRFAKSGNPGDEFDIKLELKLIADVGLLGFPNVGKSTLISVVSEAKPKIANYHFTTLTPVLGVVRIAEGTSFVMADIPGVIEGAADGLGLGHEFLRHVERCRLLLHVLDVSGSEGRDPIEDFEKINNELAVFSAELAALPQIVVANKCDLATEEQIETLKKYIEAKGLPFFTIMAAIGENTKTLMNYVAAELVKLPPVVHYEAEPAPIEILKVGREFSITVEDNVYIVEARWLLKTMSTIDADDYESLQYFQRVLKQSGIIDALIEKGVQEGDTVSIYDMEFDYIS